MCVSEWACVYARLNYLNLQKKKKKKSDTRMTASILEQDPNTSKVKKKAIY